MTHKLEVFLKRRAPLILTVLLGFLSGTYYEDGLTDDIHWLKTVINIVTAKFVG